MGGAAWVGCECWASADVADLELGGHGWVGSGYVGGGMVLVILVALFPSVFCPTGFDQASGDVRGLVGGGEHGYTG